MMFLLIVICGLSQTDYPKSKLIDGDTVAIFNAEQVRKINYVVLDRKRLLMLTESLEQEIDLRKIKDSIANKQIETLKSQISLKSGVIVEKQTQYDACNGSLDLCGKRLRRTKFAKYLYLGGGALLGTALGIIIAN